MLKFQLKRQNMITNLSCVNQLPEFIENVNIMGHMGWQKFAISNVPPYVCIRHSICTETTNRMNFVGPVLFSSTCTRYYTWPSSKNRWFIPLCAVKIGDFYGTLQDENKVKWRSLPGNPSNNSWFRFNLR